MVCVDIVLLGSHTGDKEAWTTMHGVGGGIYEAQSRLVAYKSVWWTRLVLCSSVKFGHGLKAEVVALVETGKTSEVRLQQMAGL